MKGKEEQILAEGEQYAEELSEIYERQSRRYDSVIDVEEELK